MSKAIALAGAVILAVIVSACASQPHTDATMLSGSHAMPPKDGYMSDRSMPGGAPFAPREALDKMPPEHRAARERAQSHNP